MTAKERILQYIDKKGITQYSFSQKTGLSNGFLKSGSSLSVDNLRLISGIFSDLNVVWVITGEGEMCTAPTIGHTQIGVQNKIDHSPINVNTNNQELEQLKTENELLKERLKDKEEIIKLLKTKK